MCSCVCTSYRLAVVVASSSSSASPPSLLASIIFVTASCARGRVLRAAVRIAVSQYDAGDDDDDVNGNGDEDVET